MPYWFNIDCVRPRKNIEAYNGHNSLRTGSKKVHIRVKWIWNINFTSGWNLPKQDIHFHQHSAAEVMDRAP